MKNLRFQRGNERDLQWMTMTIFFLSIGVILCMVSPNLGGITLNWTIVMYTMVIMLCNVSIRQGLAIGLVAGLVATIASKSSIPYLNLVNEPLVAMVCAFCVRKRIFRINILGRNIEPFMAVFVTTLLSGGNFVVWMTVILNLPVNVLIYAMLPTVFLVALLGAVAGQLIYYPARAVYMITGRKDKDGDYVMKDVNINIKRGSFNVVAGGNGDGKTTLLLTLAGGDIPYVRDFLNSKIILNDIDVLNSTAKELRKTTGMVMADYETQLVTETVEDEIDFSLENEGLSPDEIITRRNSVVKLTGLSGLENRKITGLSGGQKQRLAIAVMIAMQKEILILDEPVAAIDPEGAREIYELLNKIRKENGTTIIVAEHDLKYAFPYADNLIVVEGGEMKVSNEFKEGIKEMFEKNIYGEAVPLMAKIRLQLGEAL